MKIREVKVGETFLGEVVLPFLEVSGEQSGQTLGLISGVHGDELSSVGGLIKFLEEIDRISKEKILGKIFALPFANPYGLMQRERGVKNVDLNRNFPGDKKGTLPERIAYAIISFFKDEKVDLAIDIHTMNPLAMPHLIIDRIRVDRFLKEQTLSLAALFGLGAVYDFPQADYEKRCLFASSSAQLLSAGIPSFAVEVPGVFYSPSGGEEIVRQGLWNIVRELEIYTETNTSRWEHPTKTKLGIGTYSYLEGPKVDHAGFFRHCVEAGNTVVKGQTLGEIIDRKTCKVVEQVISPTNGFVADIRDRSIVASGDSLFYLFVTENSL